MPELFKGLGVAYPGKVIMKWQEFERWGMHSLQYGIPARKLSTLIKPLAAIGVAAATAFAGFRLVSARAHRPITD